MLAIALWLLDEFFQVANSYVQDPNWYFAPSPLMLSATTSSWLLHWKQ
jgi:hypothetical protein